MSGIDLSFVSGKEKFNYRVCAVIQYNAHSGDFFCCILPFSKQLLVALYLQKRLTLGKYTLSTCQVNAAIHHS